jgi:hypothetical protein
VEQFGPIPPQRTQTPTLESQPPDSCPFCVIGISHDRHVPSDVVRIGHDFGDKE